MMAMLSQDTKVGLFDVGVDISVSCILNGSFLSLETLLNIINVTDYVWQALAFRVLMRLYPIIIMCVSISKSVFLKLRQLITIWY